MKVLIRALPESGGGVYPCPNFLVLFFHQVIVPKKVIFYPKLTIFIGFSVIFVTWTVTYNSLHFPPNLHPISKYFQGKTYRNCHLHVSQPISYFQIFQFQHFQWKLTRTVTYKFTDSPPTYFLFLNISISTFSRKTHTNCHIQIHRLFLMRKIV